MVAPYVTVPGTTTETAAPTSTYRLQTRSNGSMASSSDVPTPSTSSPEEDAITRLTGAVLLKQNDECAVQRARYMTLEDIAPVSDNSSVALPTVTA